MDERYKEAVKRNMIGENAGVGMEGIHAGVAGNGEKWPRDVFGRNYG